MSKKFKQFLVLSIFPIGLYTLKYFSKKVNGKRSKLFIWSIIKLPFDLFYYLMIIMSVTENEKEIFTICISWLIGGIVLFTEVSKDKEKEVKNIEEVKKVKEVKKDKERAEVKSKKEKNKDYIFETLDLYSYVGTGEIFKFEYMGEKDYFYKKREVIIERVYEKNGNEYIDAFDLDRQQNRTFRVDRMKSID